MDKNGSSITYSCDVLVIGSGVSGYCAAIQAARCGCKTIIIEKDGVLGGNSGPNLGVGITGANRYFNYAGETGIIQEIQEDAAWAGVYDSNGGNGYTISKRLEATVQYALESAGVQVLKNHYAHTPVVEENKIVAVLGEDLAGFRHFRIDIQHAVIEASGDGETGALAGADFDTGSESRSEFNERSAPTERTTLRQGSSIVGIAYNAGRPIQFVPPPGTPPMRLRTWEGSFRSFITPDHLAYVKTGSHPEFLYMTESGGDQDTIREDGAIYDNLLKMFWSLWDDIKNGQYAEQAKNLDLLWVSPKTGKRESRRFLGDYILTQTDLEEGRRFDDAIAYGGHNLDDHQPLPGGHSNINGYSIPPLYDIPYRSCYSRNVNNLLLGGRLISATHLAHSSIRVMRTGAAIGQAVGLAAGLCKKYNCSPRELGRDRMKELQNELLRSDATILTRPLPFENDLARSASASATSESMFNSAQPGRWIPLVNQGGNLVYAWNSTIEIVEVFLRNISDKPQRTRVSFLRTTRQPKWRHTDNWFFDKHTFLQANALGQLFEMETIVPPNFEGWHKIILPKPLSLSPKDSTSNDDALIISLDANAYLQWALSSVPNEFLEFWEFRHQTNDWAYLNAIAAMRLDPAPFYGEASQIINGFTRRLSTAPVNMWRAASAELPQEIILSWETPQTFSRVQLFFDNLPRLEHEHLSVHGPHALPYLVKSYILEAEQKDGWKELAREEINIHRFRQHQFAAITSGRLRLRIMAMHGQNEPPRVYEIAVYKN